MNIIEFDKHCESLNFGRRKVVEAKRPEYTEGNVDVLNNFKTIAKELSLDPKQVWYVYFRKHVASIGRYCANPNMAMSEPIDGRLEDAMNYLELLYGLIKEEEKRQGDGVPAAKVRLKPGQIIPLDQVPAIEKKPKGQIWSEDGTYLGDC